MNPSAFSSESFDVNVPRADGTCWTLLANAKLVARNSTGAVKILDVTTGSVSISAFLSGYIAALGMLANDVTGFPVELRVYGASAKANGIDRFSISRSREEAVDLLNAMYSKMFVEKFRKIVPIKLLAENLANPYDLSEKLSGRYGPWSFFAGRKMFDVKSKDVSGYNDKDNRKFALEWQEAVDTMKSLMPDFSDAFKPKESSSAKKGKK